MKYDDNDNIEPTAIECRSDINCYPAVDDTQRDDSKNASAVCPIANTTRSTNTNGSDDDDEEDSDEEIGAMIYASSNTARARRAAAEAEPVMNDSNRPSSYEPRSEVRKRKSSSDISSKEMKSAPTRKNKSFDQRVADLRAYKEKHGNVNVKKRDDKSLYDFCNNTRHARNNPGKSSYIINDDRIASLDALGFDWAVNEQVAKKSFEQRIADLIAYKEKHGQVNVKKREDKSLYEFCIQMRYARKKPEKSTVALTDGRISSLDALGFDWGTTNSGIKSFEQRMDDIRAHKEKHGHINVKEKEDKSLYRFCVDMRRARKHPEKSDRALTDDRIASLDALGFDWRMS